MKKIVALFLALAMVFSLAACGGGQSTDGGADQGSAPAAPTADAGETEGGAAANVDSPVAGKKVAYIMSMAPSDIFMMWDENARATAEALGMEYNSYFCGGSDSDWQDTISSCAASGYDGLLLSHGGQDYAWRFLTDLLQQYPDLRIVTFDTPFKDENGEVQTIDGVTQFFQQDAGFAEILLDYICTDLYPEKDTVNVLKAWLGPNFNSPFDRRQVGYAPFEEDGRIHTVDTIGPTDIANMENSTADVATSYLAQYGSPEAAAEAIDAIWCAYDAFAAGVYTALTQGGYDIPLVTVDICNADIDKMAAENSPWMACATTNWNYNGEFGMRVLALELADEYDHIIDPITGEVSAWLELPTTIVTQDMVSGGGITVMNLDTVAGEGYSDRSWMPTTDWMVAILGD